MELQNIIFYLLSWTPLLYAVDIECPDTVMMLLQAGADVNLQAPHGAVQFPPALAVAARNGKKPMVELLLKNGNYSALTEFMYSQSFYNMTVQ